MDRISNLLLVIIENILCFLPIQEAGRTSILSREWRCHWIKIPKLTICEATFQVSIDGADLSILEQEFDTQRERIRIFRRRKFLYAINQLLSMHEGPIHEFTLSIEVKANCGEIDHILSHLAQRNTVKKLKLLFDLLAYRPFLYLYSFCHLTDLFLEGCHVSSSPTLCSLTRLSLQNISIFFDTLRHLLSNCRFLKSLTLGIDAYYVFKNGSEDSSIISLFECLPVIETLSISLGIIQVFKSSVNDSVPRELPTALIHLKYLTINDVSFTHKDGLSILVLLIKSSPNLEKLEIGNRRHGFFMKSGLFIDHDICSFSLKVYADIWLEHLKELHIRGFRNKGNELNFVKLILAKSPLLRKVRIYHELSSNELMQISKVILSFPRASSVVDINV